MRALLSDTVNFISTLRVRKILNASKVIGSYLLSKWTGRIFHYGNPLSISVEPTTSCNLRCPECPSGLRSFTRPTGMLDKDFFKNIIEDLKKDLLYLTLYFQGEPYLHPEFLGLVAIAVKNKIYTATSTNAHYLNDDNARNTVESGLHRLIISIDGTSQGTYQSYRVGGNLDKVIEGTKNIIRWKKTLHASTPYIIFQFLVVRHNEHEVPEVLRLAKELGVDEVRFKTAQVYDYVNGNPLIPENETYSRYRKQPDGTYVIKNELANHCWRLWQGCVITWDGNVVPCCFDKDAKYRMGDLTKNSFGEIWKNSAYKAFRTSVLKSRKEIDICSNCTEGTKTWA